MASATRASHTLVHAGTTPLKLARHVIAPVSSSASSHHQHHTPPHHYHHYPPVLFIHGLLGSATNFRTIQQKMGKERYTVAVDLRNHGKTSPHIDGPMTLETLADDVERVIQDMETDVRRNSGGREGEDKKKEGHHETGLLYSSFKVDIIGHSLGGKTAIILGMKYPHLIRKLVVVDIAPVSYNEDDAQWKSVASIVRAAHALNPHLFTSRGAIDKVFAKTVTDPGVRSFVSQNLVPRPDGSYEWRINTGAILASMENFAKFPASREALSLSSVLLHANQHGKQSSIGSSSGSTGVQSSFSSPEEVHFIAGEKSSYLTKPSQLDACTKLFPTAQFHTVKGAGHWVHAEKPAEFWHSIAHLFHLHDTKWP